MADRRAPSEYYDGRARWVALADRAFPDETARFTPLGVSLDDASDLTPEVRALALEQMKKFRLGPIFTPPRLRGTLMRPSNTGGANLGRCGLLFPKWVCCT